MPDKPIDETQVVVDDEEELRVAGRPLKLPKLHRASGPELEHGVRDIKLLRPICHECAPDVEKAGWGWWNRCEHDPYIGLKGEVITETVYEDEKDAKGRKTGGRIVGQTTQQTILRPWPNWAPVAQTRRLNSGRGPEYKMELYGFIYPQDLRSVAFPDGIAPCCEFRNCFWQDDLVTYAVGTFCQEREAILVYENEIGTVPEVANLQIREDQYAVSRMKLAAAKA